MTDATQMGVEVNERFKSRMAEIDAIAGVDDEPETDPVEIDEPEEVEQPTEPNAEDDPGEEVEQEPEAKIGLKDKRKLKVDGVEQEATVEELIEAGIKARQKESAADARLAEATRLLKEAQATTHKPQLSQDVAQQPKVDASLVQAIQQGTEEEAAQALSDLMERQRTTPDQINDVVATQVQAILETQKTQTMFSQSFPDIVKDQRLYKLAAEEVQRRLESGEPNTWETYEAAGKEIAAWANLSKPDTSMSNKEQRKRSVTTLPSAGGKLPSKTDDKPESVTDVINEIRKARKQI